MEKFGKLVKAERKRQGLTQAEFGAVFGVTRQAVSLWEHGKRKPSIRALADVRDDSEPVTWVWRFCTEGINLLFAEWEKSIREVTIK